ncbi:MAG: hypothetical protein ACOX9E_12785 [Lentisphaeria bacterium]|jgi:hypothetical protein
MVKRLRRNMDIMDTMDDNTCSLVVHTVHTVHSSLRKQQLSMSDRLLLKAGAELFPVVYVAIMSILWQRNG